MKSFETFFWIALLCLSNSCFAQLQIERSYEPSAKFPYGRVNPTSEEALKAFAPLIGECECRSLKRNPDQTWSDTTNLVWEYKYIMNGTSIQDISWGDDGTYSSSVRQYNVDSAKWYVTYFSSASVSANPSTWNGGLRGNDIVLYNEQKAPNGMEGYFKITFENISESGFDWKGEWVDKAESISFPTWFLWCKKR